MMKSEILQINNFTEKARKEIWSRAPHDPIDNLYIIASVRLGETFNRHHRSAEYNCFTCGEPRQWSIETLIYKQFLAHYHYNLKSKNPKPANLFLPKDEWIILYKCKLYQHFFASEQFTEETIRMWKYNKKYPLPLVALDQAHATEIIFSYYEDYIRPYSQVGFHPFKMS